MFLADLEIVMKDLITHINNKEYDETVVLIEKMIKPSMLRAKKESSKDLYADYLATKEITEMVNRAEINSRDILNELKSKIKSYFEDVRKENLRDWIIDPENQKRMNSGSMFFRLILATAGFPFYLIGLVFNWLPFYLSGLVTRTILKGNKEFYSSVWIGLGTVIFLIHYCLLFFGLYLFSPNILYPILIILVSGITGMFALDFHFYLLKCGGLIRAIMRKKEFQQFGIRRKEILDLINKF